MLLSELVIRLQFVSDAVVGPFCFVQLAEESGVFAFAQGFWCGMVRAIYLLDSLVASLWPWVFALFGCGPSRGNW